MFKTYYLLILIITAFQFPGHSQRFKAAAILGANASQIDGDNLYGFHKLGLSVGGRLSYENKKSVDYALEMLYSQRGSAVKIFNNNAGDRISLNYIEFPLLISLRDWYMEDGAYYKVRAEGGFSYGYLFGADAVGFQESYFRKHDVSWILGVGLHLTRMWGLSLRYTSSLYNMYRDPTADKSTLKGYFITLRSEIHF